MDEKFESWKVITFYITFFAPVNAVVIAIKSRYLQGEEGKKNQSNIFIQFFRSSGYVGNVLSRVHLLCESEKRAEH